MDSNELKCEICLEENELDSFYTLPECQHSFHTNCIMHWFRNGNRNCPYCNNNGLVLHDHKYYYNISKEKLLPIIQYSKKKECPNTIKKLVEKRKLLEKKIKDNQIKLKDFLNSIDENKSFKELKTIERKIRNDSRRFQTNKRKIERDLVHNSNIKPIILVIKKYI